MSEKVAPLKGRPRKKIAQVCARERKFRKLGARGMEGL